MVKKRFPTMKPLGAAAKKERKEIDLSKVKVEPFFKDMVDFDSFSVCDFCAAKIKSCEAVPKSKKLLKFILNDGSGTICAPSAQVVHILSEDFSEMAKPFGDFFIKNIHSRRLSKSA